MTIQPGVSFPRTHKALELLSSSQPLVIGHRGAARWAPENTLPSFNLGLQSRADMIELDYHHSSDGVPMVIHDPTLYRTTDAAARWGKRRVAVKETLCADLQTLDAGEWFSPQFRDARIATLNEALAAIQVSAATLIERKSGDAASCLKVLRQGQWVNEVIVQAFDWDFLRDLHRLEPTQVLGALGPPPLRTVRSVRAARRELTSSWIDALLDTGARVVGWNSKVTRDGVAYAHDLQLKVFVYTVNDEAEANRLLDLGVDGLISDDPALIRKVIEGRCQKGAKA